MKLILYMMYNKTFVKQTIDQTTQWGVALDSFPMKRHLKSRSPALNVPRRHESVAVSFKDIPAVNSGESLVADVYWQTVCKCTGGQHQKKGSYGRIIG